MEDHGEIPPEMLAEEFTAAKGLQHIVAFAAPISLSQISFSLVGIVSVLAAGRMGIVQLGAAALTFSFINATSYAVAAGFCGALDTLFSHSYGNDPNSKKYGTYAQRMTIILMLMSFPLAALFAYCEPLLEAMGQTKAISQHVALFTQFCLIGLIPSLVLEVARRYYQSQHLTVPVAVATALGSTVINPLAILIFYFVFNAGFVSLPLAWSTLQIVTLAGLAIYGKYSGLEQRTWAGWNDEALQHWAPMLKLGFFSFLMMVSEFIVVEINSMTAGFEGEVALAAFSITGQMTFLGWNIAAGFYGTMSVLVGTYVGAGKPLVGKQYAYLGTAVVFGLSLINGLWMWFLGDIIAAAYSDDEAVRAAFKPILPCAILFHIGDVVQSNTLGIFRGCGMQKRGALAVACSYALVGMPLGWFMCFYLQWGVGMLWLGPALGVIFVGWPMCFQGIIKTDWATLTAHEEKPAGVDFA